MTKAQAMAWAASKWGKKAALRNNPKAPTKEGRASARERWDELKNQEPRLREDWQTRAEYDAHRAARRAWLEEKESLESRMHWYRCSLGYVDWAFHIEGEGDSWAEAVEAAKKRG